MTEPTEPTEPATADPNRSHRPDRPASIRKWPAVVILVAAVAAVVAIQFISYRSQQDRNIDVAKAVGFSFCALLLWVLFASRLRWKVRLGIIGGVVALIAATAGMFRVRGVTGNLVPILEPRWAARGLVIPAAPVLTNTPVFAPPGAADFPQFLGPSRNGQLPGPTLATNWTARPPVRLWRQPVGAAWSGFAVAGSRAVTQEQRGEDELTVCYELLTGEVIWSHATQARYFTALAGEGPRATPTLAGGKVFAQGATGILTCLDLESGRAIWSQDILQLGKTDVPSWGHSSSPLVLDDVVIVNAGGKPDRTLLALRKSDGSLAWNGGRAGSTYSSPFVATLDGVRQIVLFANAVVGHDIATGGELWRFSWPGGHPHIAVPLVVNETDLIVSSGYGTGSGRVRIRRDSSGAWQATAVWRGNRFKAKFTNPVLHRGHVYGLDDGILACLEAVSGKLLWKDGRYGHGQTLLVGERLLVMAESGEVILVDPQPDGLREWTRFTALEGKTWNPPALAGEYLLVRNDKEAACYRLPVE